MVFGFWRKKKEPAREPLAAYDDLIAELERQAGALRRSAATLLSLKADLERDLERAAQKLADLSGRRSTALEGRDARSAQVLEQDLAQASAQAEAGRAALASANDDAQLLLEAASELAGRIAELQTERLGAQARLKVGELTTRALRERAEKVDKLLALDAARDELERAHALAELYREDQRTKL